MELSILLTQGMARNYFEFLAALGQGSVSLFAAGRGGLVTLAKDL